MAYEVAIDYIHLAKSAKVVIQGAFHLAQFAV